MARPGLFDSDDVPWGWFDDCGQDQGWFDRDLLTYPEIVPPPPPPPPVPVRRRPRVSGGGGGGGGYVPQGLKPYCPPDWLRPWLPDLLPFVEDEEPKEEEEAHYAFLHVTGGAVIRAMADGVVAKFIDEKGRLSVVLTANDETRYWYVDVGASLVTDGECVKAGQAIARTKPNASDVPTITQGAPALPPPAPGSLETTPGALGAPETQLLSGHVVETPSSSAPTQVVFVESPPGPESPPAQTAPAPAQLLPRKMYLLVPAPTPPPPPPPPPSMTKRVIHAAAKIGAVAALLYLLSLIDRRTPPPRSPPKKRTKHRKTPKPPKRRPLPPKRKKRRRWRRRRSTRRCRLR